MDIVRFIVGVLLPYVAIIVFVAGMIWRIRTWRKLASPPMTLFPAPGSAGANTRNTLKEAVLFSSLFRGDRVLWSIAWVFHVVLALIFVGHFRVFANVDRVLTGAGMSEDAIGAMSGGVGGAAGVIILILVALLLVRRMTLQRVREITGVADYLALLLIALIIITGNVMRFGGEHFDLALTREYFADLVTFGNAWQAAALQNNVFLAHLGLAFLLIMCMPFSKLLHFGGIFFTHQLVRK
ncbi:MAG: respiratory nitrate reductase subunit gamma [Planctomycetota bacterium]|jgi:nitrate reductase gamma subunit